MDDTTRVATFEILSIRQKMLPVAVRLETLKGKLLKFTLLRKDTVCVTWNFCAYKLHYDHKMDSKKVCFVLWYVCASTAFNGVGNKWNGYGSLLVQYEGVVPRLQF